MARNGKDQVVTNDQIFDFTSTNAENDLYSFIQKLESQVKKSRISKT